MVAPRGWAQVETRSLARSTAALSSEGDSTSTSWRRRWRKAPSPAATLGRMSEIWILVGDLGMRARDSYQLSVTSCQFIGFRVGESGLIFSFELRVSSYEFHSALTNRTKSFGGSKFSLDYTQKRKDCGKKATPEVSRLGVA